jgi:hypothetical protein
VKRFRAECRGEKQNKNVSLFHAGVQVPVGFSRTRISKQISKNKNFVDFHLLSIEQFEEAETKVSVVVLSLKNVFLYRGRCATVHQSILCADMVRSESLFTNVQFLIWNS